MIALIHNPSKDEARFREAVELLEQRRVAFSIYPTRSRPDIVSQCQLAIRDGATTVVACGGDGTVLGVLNGCMETGVPMGILPLGCSNDYAIELGIPTVRAAVGAICDGPPLSVDVIEATYVDFQGRPAREYCCSSAGVGFFATVFEPENTRVVSALKRLLGDHIWPILNWLALARFRPTPAEIELDGEVRAGGVSCFEISKARTNGGYAFLPETSPTSGSLEYWHAGAMSRLALARFIRGVLAGRPPSSFGEVEVSSARVISVDPRRRLLVHLNGELVGTTPVSFRVLPGAASCFGRSHTP